MAKRDWILYANLLVLVTLLNMVFTVLRSVRSALAVADIGGTAMLIPYYELLGTVPAAIAFTWLLAHLLRRFSLPRVFLFTLAGFITFFVVYAVCIYPLWRHYAPQVLAHDAWWAIVIARGPIMVFFAIAEMWKVVLLSILLWTYINQFMALDNAKVIYAPLMLGSSLGAMLAHPLTGACNGLSLLDGWAVDKWHAALTMQIGAIVFASIAIALLFSRLKHRLGTPAPSPSLSLRDAVVHSFRSPYLSALAVIVIVDYLIYSLVEVVFLAKLKQRYPHPMDYCQMMTQLAQWGGALTAVTSLWLGPLLFKRLSWTTTALATPVVIIPVVLFFLGIVIAEDKGWFTQAEGLSYAIWSGSFIYCLGRATKYALLDTSKELAFIPLPREEQLQGKLAIEALASRGGRGLASLSSIALFGVAGTVAGSVPALLVLVTIGFGVWVRATFVVGSSFGQREQRNLPERA